VRSTVARPELASRQQLHLAGSGESHRADSYAELRGWGGIFGGGRRLWHSVMLTARATVGQADRGQPVGRIVFCGGALPRGIGGKGVKRPLIAAIGAWDVGWAGFDGKTPLRPGFHFPGFGQKELDVTNGS
jgi:hypothetical protein